MMQASNHSNDRYPLYLNILAGFMKISQPIWS